MAIYAGEKTILEDELKEIENIPIEQLVDIGNDIKVSNAVIRSLLKQKAP